MTVQDGITEAGIPVDANVVALIDALNEINGVRTFASCGGHPDPTAGQVGEGDFTVSLDFTEDASGWLAITVIALAIKEAELKGGTANAVKLTPWTDNVVGAPTFGLHFDLSGTRVSPALLAVSIRRFNGGVSQYAGYTVS